MKRHKLLQLLHDNAHGRAEGERSLRLELDGDIAHLYVYDVIDAWWGASAQKLVTALAEAGGRDVHLHINSPGGDVFEARAMASALVAYTGQVVSCIDGLAASAATTLALAGNEVRITEGGLFMVHNSWTLAWGNKTELRDTADLLDKVDQSIAGDYVSKTGKALQDIVTWMDDETWFSASEALAAGFVDSVVPNSKRADGTQASERRWDLSAYRHPPKLPEPKRDDDTAARVSQQLQMNRNRLHLLNRV